jgi:hypothetical protein
LEREVALVLGAGCWAQDLLPVGWACSLRSQERWAGEGWVAYPNVRMQPEVGCWSDRRAQRVAGAESFEPASAPARLVGLRPLLAVRRDAENSALRIGLWWNCVHSPCRARWVAPGVDGASCGSCQYRGAPHSAPGSDGVAMILKRLRSPNICRRLAVTAICDWHRGCWGELG